jgi:hypothetical protein
VVKNLSFVRAVSELTLDKLIMIEALSEVFFHPSSPRGCRSRQKRAGYFRKARLPSSGTAPINATKDVEQLLLKLSVEGSPTSRRHPQGGKRDEPKKKFYPSPSSPEHFLASLPLKVPTPCH